MAAIEEVNLLGLSSFAEDSDRRRIIGAAFWMWFHGHQDDKVTTIKVWFISRTVYVRDLRQIFVLLFGPEL
jgi:hypothetical protein